MTTSRARNVLLVDDNHDIVDTLATLFEVSGYETTKAYDGYAACEAARERMPNVIILDLGMPWMDGYEAARAIRKMPGARDVAIIAVSGNTTAETTKKANAAGFTKHFAKPLDFGSLSAYLDSVS